jgi:hypothetical protein
LAARSLEPLSRHALPNHSYEVQWIEVSADRGVSGVWPRRNEVSAVADLARDEGDQDAQRRELGLPKAERITPRRDGSRARIAGNTGL